MSKVVTCESVRAGHPDKMCDFISDSILDACLEVDRNCHVAVETLITVNNVVVAGEVKITQPVDYESVIKKALCELSYNPDDYKITNFIHEQSKDIDGAVVNHDEMEQGAGDQGTMYGFATNETKSNLPLPLEIAHTICMTLDDAMKEKTIKGIMPDGKAQVTVEYDTNNNPIIKSIVVSAQHNSEITIDDFNAEIKKLIDGIELIVKYKDDKTKYFINPSGEFLIGGPEGDTGLTGRKIIVDTYGGVAPHGGGAFSGKDPSKVDRSAAYMARYLAKYVVAKGWANKCCIGLSYAIGVANPTAITINTYGENTIPDVEIVLKLYETFKLTPYGIIKFLDLKNPIYKSTSAYGHFTNQSLPWEKVKL